MPRHQRLRAPRRPALAACLLALGVLLPVPVGAEPVLGCPDPFESDVAAFVNEERESFGLEPVAVDVRLTEAAQLHADDMAARDYVSHTGADGSRFVDRIEAAGYQPWYRLAENVAGGQPDAAAVVAAWMGSPGHRANLLDPDVEDLGVGYAYAAGTRYRHHWALELGLTSSPLESPLAFCPACSNGFDDDGDGLVDHPADPKCASASDIQEAPGPRCGLGFEAAPFLVALAALRRRRRR